MVVVGDSCSSRRRGGSGSSKSFTELGLRAAPRALAVVCLGWEDHLKHDKCQQLGPPIKKAYVIAKGDTKYQQFHT